MAARNPFPAGTHPVTVVSHDGVTLPGSSWPPAQPQPRAADHLRRRARLHELGGPAGVPPAGRLAAPVRGGPRPGLPRARPLGRRRRRRVATRRCATSTPRWVPPVPTARTPWSPSGSRWAGERRCARRPWAGTGRTPWSASARSAAGTSATPARCGGCTGCWRPPPDAGSGARLLGLRLGEPWLIPADLPAAGRQRHRAHAAAARARRPRRVLPARALPHAGAGGRADGHRLGGAGLRTRRERRHRSARRADRTLGVCHDRPVSQRLSEAQESAPSARGHHLPAAGLTVVAVALLVALPELLGDLGRLAAVLVLQLGLVLAWVLVTGIEGFAGSLAVGAAAAVAADLLLVLPERPVARRPAGRLRRRLPRRRAAADVPPAAPRPRRLAVGHGPAALPGRRAGARCCCSAGRRARDRRAGRAAGGRAARWSPATSWTSCCRGRSCARRAARAARPGAGGAGRRRGHLSWAATSRDLSGDAGAPSCSGRRWVAWPRWSRSPRATSWSRRPAATAADRHRRRRRGRCRSSRSSLPLAACAPGRPRPADRPVKARVASSSSSCCVLGLAGPRRPGGPRDRRGPGGRPSSPSRAACRAPRTSTIAGFPFLTQALAGRYDDVRISLTADELGQPEGTRADVAAPRRAGAAVRACCPARWQEVPVDRIDGTATLSYALLSDQLGGDTTLRPRGRRAADHPDRRACSGRRVPLTAVGTVTLDGDELVVDVERGPGAGVELPDFLVEQAADLLDLRYTVPALPVRPAADRRDPGRRRRGRGGRGDRHGPRRLDTPAE